MDVKIYCCHTCSFLPAAVQAKTLLVVATPWMWSETKPSHEKPRNRKMWMNQSRKGAVINKTDFRYIYLLARSKSEIVTCSRVVAVSFLFFLIGKRQAGHRSKWENEENGSVTDSKKHPLFLSLNVLGGKKNRRSIQLISAVLSKSFLRPGVCLTPQKVNLLKAF